MIWVALHPSFHPEDLGFLPSFLNEENPAPAREQLDANYQHGGGWRPLPGWTFDPKTLQIKYPGDPPLSPLAMTALRGEKILFYPYAQVMVVQPDGSFEVCHMD